MKREDLVGASKMSPFTMFIDDVTKLATFKKIKAIGIDTPKGPMAATIRVLLNEFSAGTFDSLLGDIKQKIEAECLFTTTKNKRSVL